jgi:phosphoglycerol transferase MdoB-like AlkP superfamily enzyme
MDISQVFNSVEMFFWMSIGAIFFASGFYNRNRYKKLTFFLSIVFVAFGLSDGVEFHTGAWWHPWWLLLWKVLCVAIFALSLTYYLWRRRHLSQNK